METRFTICGVLGKGAYGTVYLCRDKRTAHVRAVKRIPCADIEEVNLSMKEILQVKQIKNPYIIEYYDCFFEKSTKGFMMNIVMDHVNSGDLSLLFRKKIQKENGKDTRVPEEFIVVLIEQIGSALNEIHRHKIIHRDVSLRNVMIHIPSFDDDDEEIEGEVKKKSRVEWENFDSIDDIRFRLVDFGNVRRLDNSFSKSYEIGTMDYLSPEIINRVPYDQKTDIFSLGAICFTLMISKRCQVFTSILQNPQYQSKLIKERGYSKKITHIVSRMLEVDPKKRISAEELTEWIRKNRNLIGGYNPHVNSANEDGIFEKLTPRKILYGFGNIFGFGMDTQGSNNNNNGGGGTFISDSEPNDLDLSIFEEKKKKKKKKDDR